MNTKKTQSQKQPLVYVKPRLLQLGNTDSIQGGPGGAYNDGYTGYYTDRQGF